LGTLSEQLFKAGLLSEKQFREQQAEEELEKERLNRAQISKLAINERKDCDELDKCLTMREFKHQAKQILLQESSQIRVVIQKAHRFKSNKKFIWFFYHVRDDLQKLPQDKHEQFLNKAFRKSGSTFTISD
jgi:hypothetical protein